MKEKRLFSVCHRKKPNDIIPQFGSIMNQLFFNKNQFNQIFTQYAALQEKRNVDSSYSLLSVALLNNQCWKQELISMPSFI